MSEYLSKLSDGAGRFLVLGFPLGLLAYLGVFCLGFAAYRSELSLSSKLFAFGAFSFCLSCSMWYLGRIYPIYYANRYGEEFRRLTRSSIVGIIGFLLFGAASFYFGKLLWALLHS